VARALVSYDHEGLTFANENYMGGMIMAFEIRDWKTFGANTCGETEQYMLYREGWTCNFYNDSNFKHKGSYQV